MISRVVIMTVLKNALSAIDGVTELEEVEMQGASDEDGKMLTFKYEGLIFTSLFLQGGDDSPSGINFRSSFSKRMSTKKTKVQILNDLNAFNHAKLGIKVILLHVKDREIRLSFDVEKWTLDKFITKESVLIDLNFMIYATSVYRAEHKYVI